MKISNGNVNSRFLSLYAWLQTMFDKSDIMLNMIRAYDPLSSGKNGYSCGITTLNNTYTADKTQRLLGQNDAFAPVAMRMVIRKTDGTNFAVAQEATFEDVTIFDAPVGSATFTENQNIQGLFFGGSVTLDVETNAIIEKIPASLLRYVPETQAGTAAVSQMGEPYSFSSFTPLYKDIIISGGTDTKVELDLKGFTPDANVTGASGEQNDVGFHLLGFVIKGANKTVMSLAEKQKCVVR